MPFLSPTHRQTLAAVCETFVPALEPTSDDLAAVMRTGPKDLGLPAGLEAALEQAMNDDQRGQLRLWLTLVESGAFNGVSTGMWGGFSTLPLAEREAVLRAWALSPLPLARMTFQALKRLTLFLFYTLRPNGSANPSWADMGYPGEVTPRPAPRPIQPLSLDRSTTLTTDALIIGSGAGGSVVAAELAAAGWDVLIVEKGDYFADGDFDGQELSATERMYEKSGALTTRDLSMIILAGSVLGGGTTVNWSASLRTPDEVLHEWAARFGFSAAAGSAFQTSLDAVCARINVGLAEHALNAVNGALVRGCQALGYAVEPVPRNVKGCEDCGFCNFGCAAGAKQGTLKTYLQDAYERGTRILVRAHAQRIVHERGRAVGAVLHVTGSDGRKHEVSVRARLVIAAGGALQTPALLLRSGLSGPHVGRHLHLHPVTVSYGMFDAPVRGWEGIPLATVSREFANLDGQGYGVRLETAPTHPGMAALVLAWNDARQHKRTMQRLAHLANIIVLTRDRGEGRVRIDRSGQPVIEYALAAADARHMMTGLKAALRVHLAAGAREVCGPDSLYRPYICDDPARGSFEEYVAAIETRGFRANRFALLSAHQMSSCRIAGSPRLGTCDPSGRSYALHDLYVADASALPTATGVNPMLSIMATAHYIAQQIKSAVTR